MSDTSSDASDGGAPQAGPRPPSFLRRLLRAATRVLVVLVCLGLLGAGAVVWAPGWLLRRSLGYATRALPAGVRLRVTSLEAETLGSPELSQVSLDVDGVGELRARRVALRIPVAGLARQIATLDGPGPLSGGMRIEGLSLRVDVAGGLQVTATAVSLAATAPVAAHLEADGARVSYPNSRPLDVEVVVAQAPWASLVAGRPEVTARLRAAGGGSAWLAAALDEAGERVLAQLTLSGADLARLPLPLPGGMTAAGALDAELQLDVALAAPGDLTRSRGTVTLRGAGLDREGDALAREGDLEIELGPDRIQVRGRLGELTPIPGLRLRDLELVARGDPAHPLALLGDGEVFAAGLDEAWPDTRIPFQIRPDRLHAGPVEIELAGIRAEASLAVTSTAELTVSARAARLQVPRVGPVELALQGRASADPGLARAPGEAVLSHWARALARPDWIDRLALRWDLSELAVTGEAGPLLALQDAVGGALEPADLRAHLEAIEVQVLDARFHLGGVIGASRQDALLVQLEGVPLLRLVDLAVPEAQVAAAGTLGAELRLGALLGAPRVEGTLAWRGQPGVSLWRRQGSVIRRIGMAMPDQEWRVSLEPGALEVDGRYLALGVPIPPRTGALRVELTSFPVRIQSKVFPERVQEFDLFTTSSLRGEIDPADLPGSRAVLELSAAGTVPTTAQPRSLRMTASVSPAHARVDGLRVLGADGETRVELFGGLALGEDVPLGFELAELPMAWLEALGVPDSAIDSLHLVVRGHLGSLAAEPGERLPEALARLGRAPLRRRLGALRGELRVEELWAREGEVAVVRLKAPLVMRLDPGRLVVLPASLDLQGHELEIGGTLTSDPKDGSQLQVRSDQVPLRSLLALALEDLPRDVGGELDGAAQLRGPLQDPSFQGALSLVGLDLALPHLASRLRGEVRLRANGAGVHLEAPGLAIDGVPVSLTGSLPTSGPGAGVLAAALSTGNLVLRRGRSRVGPIDVDLDASLDLAQWSGRLAGAVEVKGGTLVLDDYGPIGILREALARQSVAGALPTTTTAAPLGPADMDVATIAGRHELDLRLRLSAPLSLRSPLVDASLLGEVTVQKRPGVPLFVEGQAEIGRGSVFLHRHEFKIVEGRVEVRLSGGYVTSSIRAHAEARVAEHQIRLEVRGSLDEPQVSWRSTPARRETEITHLLATGRLPGADGALTGAAEGVAEFFTTSSLNRMLSSSLGLSSVRVRRDAGVSRFDVDKQLDDRTVVTYSRGSDGSDRLFIERRLGGTTTVEGGRKRDQEGTRPFIGIKRRLRFR